MAFQIMEILDVQAENVLVRVLHHDYPVTVTIRGVNKDDIVVGRPVQAEIDYDEVLAWNVVDDFKDEQSGIWQEQDGVHLLGRIRNILNYGDGKTIVDVYMQNGPEFFSVTSDAMEDLDLDPSSGLEIVVQNLYIQPTS